MRTNNFNDRKPVSRVKDYPELQVGFPECNEIIDPVSDMERIHVDLETMDLSRKNAQELNREIRGSETPEQRRIVS